MAASRRQQDIVKESQCQPPKMPKILHSRSKLTSAYFLGQPPPDLSYCGTLATDPDMFEKSRLASLRSQTMENLNLLLSLVDSLQGP